MFNVTTQLAIVFVLKQVWNNIVELGCPCMKNWWRRRKNVPSTCENVYTAWERDFDLQSPPQLALFPEYFEMLIQFGFVTMFVAAFPLAPLFALLNNIVEIRLDAYKFVSLYRRVLPTRVADIGIWSTLLQMVTKIAVITNGLLIAFTTDVIDRITYQYYYSGDGSMDKFTDFMLSTFDCEDWGDPKLCIDHKHSDVYVRFCSYRAYHHGPSSQQKAHQPYSKTEVWWQLMVIKLGFVLLFEHAIFGVQHLIQYVVPDVPEDVTSHVQRGRHISKSAMRHQAQKQAPEMDVMQQEQGAAKNPRTSATQLRRLVSAPAQCSKAISMVVVDSAEGPEFLERTDSPEPEAPETLTAGAGGPVKEQV